MTEQETDTAAMAQPPADHPEHTAMAPIADGEATRLFQPETPPPVAAAPTPTPGPIGPGTLLSYTYRVEGLIARGGMGEVHRARHVDLDTWHAVKVIRPELAQDAKMVELLRREAAALRDIRHEAVVAYDGVFRDEFGRLLLSMEFLDGPSLHAVLKNGPLAPADVALLLDRVASGLAAAHQRGIIHRDMSTDNVILPGNRVAEAKIIDFGIAKQTAMEAGTVIGDAFAGKYGYAAPEQLGLFGGGVGPQSDIYSAGLVLAAAALGQPLDMGRTPQAMIERRMSVPDLGGVEEPLRGVLASMLAPDPKDRVKTMAELVGALTTRVATITPFAAPSFPTVPPVPAEPVVAVPDTSKKAPAGIVAAIAGVLVAAGVGGFALMNREPAPVVPVVPVVSVPTPTVAQEPPSTPVEPPAPPAAPPVVAVVAPPPPPPPPAPDMATIRRQVEQAAGAVPCAGLRTADAGENRLLLSGYVGKEEDVQALRALGGGLPAPVQLDTWLSVRPWPLCETLGVAGLPARAEKLGVNGIGLTLNNPSQLYRDGEKLEVIVKAGAMGGHLTVDYIDQEGNAIHMLPMPLRRDDRVSPGQSVTLGVAASNRDRVYTISPPFGAAMILAVVTRDPLFPAERAEVEPASAYLPKLRAALAAAEAEGGVAAQSAFFSTLAK